MAEVKKLTKDMGIMDAVEQFPDAVSVFQEFGMHCFGCMAARFENLEQGCLAHGINPDELVAAVNAKLGLE